MTIKVDELEPLVEPTHHNFRDITGQRFGRLRAIVCRGMLPNGGGRTAVWHCECDCGGFVLVRVTSLTKGVTKSCGCFYRDSRVNRGTASLVRRFGVEPW
jgi:hypothetical protein